MRVFILFVTAVAGLLAQSCPGLFFREDWKEIPAALPVTQAHVANPALILSLYGPGKNGLKKSHHDKPADDPYYIWDGMCEGNCAITLRHKDSFVDLTGAAKIRWRAKQAGFRQARILLKLADGTWLVSDRYDGPAGDWREHEFIVADMRWRKLDIDKIVEGAWVEKPDLGKVDEIGWSSLMPGGASAACTRVDWIEVYGRPVRRDPTRRAY
jgi:hypothetical protein